MAIAEFINHQFDGIIRVEYDNITAQSISVCADYVAYFFKTLIADIYGRVILNMNIASDENSLRILISSDANLPLSDNEIRRLIKLARNGGFEVYPDSDSIILSTELVSTLSQRVYAVSIMDGKRIMFGKMVEIFCHGELLNSDPKPLPSPPPPIKKRPTRKKTVDNKSNDKS